METECSVLNCGNTSSNETKLFYKFPIAFNVCMQWVQNTGNQKLVQDFAFGGTELFMEKFVCSDHFRDKDFAAFGEPESGLSRDAVPHVTNVKKESEVKDAPRTPNKVQNKPSILREGKLGIKKESKRLEHKEVEPPIIEDGKPLIRKEHKSSFRNKHTSNSYKSVDASPVTRSRKKKRKDKDAANEEIISRAVMSLGDANTESFAVNAFPGSNPKKRRKKRSRKEKIKEEEEELPIPLLINPEVTITESTPDEAVSFTTSIKEEPNELEEGPLSLPLTDSYSANKSAAYGQHFIKNPLRNPQKTKSTISLPGTSFDSEVGNSESIDRLVKSPKIEMDIEEVFLSETYRDNDGNMESESDVDQLEDVPELYDDDPDFVYKKKKCKSYLLDDISDVDYLGHKNEKNGEQKRKDALRQALARQRETPDQRAGRLEKTRIRAQERRKAESEVQTAIRRYKSAVRAAIKRSGETEEEKKMRQEKNRIRAAERRKNMSAKERAVWREKNRVQTKERREKESDVKKLIRRYNNAIRASVKRSMETSEQRMERRLKDALRAAQRRKMETPEERQERLRKDRERITLRRLQLIMTETPEQREERLKKERERMYRKRHGITDTSADTSNDGTDSQIDSEENYQSLSDILSLYPPSVEIQTAEDAGHAENVASADNVEC